MAGSQMLTVSSGFPAGFGGLMAQSLRLLGKAGFYESIVELVRHFIPCDFWIVARYEHRTKPLILSESGMNTLAKLVYGENLWEHDPLPETFGASATRAVSLQELRLNGALHSSYMSYLDTTLGVQDELALLFPMSEGCFLALCLDRHEQPFTADEIRLAQELQEMLIEMHRQHMLRTIDHEVSLFLHRNGIDRSEVLILSKNNKVLYKSDAWSDAAHLAFDYEPAPERIGNTLVRETSGKDGWALSRLNCASDDAILAGANVFLLRRNGGHLEERFEQFAKYHNLTERQTQIVRLSVDGHHNASIAEQIGISVGGVKNHKLRIYEKLDITSERELFSAILMHI